MEELALRFGISEVPPDPDGGHILRHSSPELARLLFYRQANSGQRYPDILQHIGLLESLPDSALNATLENVECDPLLLREFWERGLKFARTPELSVAAIARALDLRLQLDGVAGKGLIQGSATDAELLWNRAAALHAGGFKLTEVL